MFSILIVDSITLLRCGLKQVLMAELGLTSIDEAANVELAGEQFANRRWDVLVLGLTTFQQDHQLIEEAKQYFPSTKILLLGWAQDRKTVSRAVYADAIGYLRRTASIMEIKRTFRRILAGERDVIERALTSTASLPHTKLSRREQIVVTAIAQGKRTGEIASELNLDVRTVSTYRRRALQKMKMRTNADVVRYVSEHEMETYSKR